VSAGFSRDFLSQLRRESVELAAMANNYERWRGKRARATEQIRREMKKAMESLMAIEGILMAQQIDPADFGTWKSMRRVTSRIGRPTDRVLANRAKRSETAAATETVLNAS
jgi:hypothetical protein